MDDVIRTRIYIRDASKWEPVSRRMARVFSDILSANTLVEVGNLIGDYEVDIEADAVISIECRNVGGYAVQRLNAAAACLPMAAKDAALTA